MPQEQHKTDVEYLRDWFRTCPAILKSNVFRVDYLTETPTEYAIYATPTAINYRENVLGERIPMDIQTLNFVFASKEVYGADVQQNLKNLGFYEQVAAWVLEQNNIGNLPHLNEGMIKSIVPTLTAYPAEVGSDAAKYQIQLQITYRRK